MTLPSRANLVARNEARFREVNATLHDGLARHPDVDDWQLVAFVCECADADCHELVRIPLDRYGWVRASPLRFVVRPGHEAPDFERVVDSDDTWAAVEKLERGEATDIVRGS